MISCKNVTKVFSGQTVLDEITYTFDDNGFYLLFGESGSGKTTFLNVLAGFLPFEGGHISWNGVEFEGRVEYTAVDDCFDYITQDSFFVDFLSVLDNMRLISKDDNKIMDMLRRVGLETKTEQLPSTLSGGEKQRLAIARSLISGKKTLLLDEPTAALDGENKKMVFELLSGLKQSVLIICSSHDAQAKDYADHTICFKKTKRDAAVSAEEEIHITVTAPPKSRASAEKGKDADYFLKKWFRRKNSGRKSNLLFAFFMVLCSALCLLADTPQHKFDATMENLYKINFFTVRTRNKTSWEDIAPGSEGIREVMLMYNGSCPDGGPDPENDIMRLPTVYEILIEVLPFDDKLFKLSDRIGYGGYFTDKNQVIISPEMADELAEGLGCDYEHLIGEHITKNVYGMGDVSFEIAGIFKPFNDFENLYLTALGVVQSYDGGEYIHDDYIDLFYVNSLLTEELQKDEGFYTYELQRQYKIIFDSYSDMKSYYERYSEQLNSNKSVEAYYDKIDTGVRDTISALFYIYMPLAVFMVFFATLFYIMLKKTEFVYNSRFIAVFEYSGYSKRYIINRFIMLNIVKLAKILLVSEAVAFVITLIVNRLNSRLVIVDFQIFTYNPVLIIAFNLFVIIVSAVAMNILFRRVRISSWYENLIAARDLI